jgi:hypothetical protein
MTEYLRPWKLATLAIGILILLIGGELEHLDDWTPAVSVSMAVATYLTAPWAVRVFIERRWGLMPFAFLAGWFSVDVVYSFFQFARRAHEFATLREANWPTSTCLYLLCGLIWLYRGSLTELWANLLEVLANRHTSHR